jgi:type VI secretion system secreted protein VgrG
MAEPSDIISVSDLAGYPLHLHWMSGEEMLGGHLAGLFEYRIEVASSVEDIAARDVLGKKLTVKLVLPEGGSRYFNGHVSNWGYRGMRDDRAIYRATVHPWLWFLNFTADCRAFNGKSAVEIVKRVFAKYGEADFEDTLSSDYPPYDFVVQYRETDFNLVCRLLQQEGAYFFFRHEAERHKLVLADGPGAYKKAPGYEEIPYVPPTTAGKQMRKHFDRWKSSQEIQPRSYGLGDFDFQKVRVDLRAMRSADPKQERFSIGEIFDYPGRYLDQGRGETLAALRLAELSEESQTIEVEGNPWGLGVGNIFTLPNPPRSEKPIDFLVTSAHYELRVPEERSGGTTGGEPPYSAKYTLLPTTEQFRPRRITPKPAILGPQTAVVVGMKKTAESDPEEIVTDPYGRVRVRFHWERIGTKWPDIRGDHDLTEEENTCWVRVAQMWAGNRWGAIHLPRVGQEVVVEFLEGNPDRPLITGSVYNADNMPPYELPAKKTQSGIKSRSTKGGNASNFNEIRFEDEKGREELHMRAEKDMSTLVKHDQSLTVGADRSMTVEGNRSATVKKDDAVTIEGEHHLTVTKAVTEIFKDDHTLKVTGQQNLDVEKDKNEHVKLAYTLTTDKAFHLNQEATHLTFEGTNVTLDSAGVVTVKRGEAKVSIDRADKVTVSSPSGVSLECGESKIELLPSGIAIAAKAVTASSGTSRLVLESSGAEMKSEAVNIEAEGVCSVMGKNILKLNTP